MYEQFGDRFASVEEVQEVSTEVNLKNNEAAGAGLPLMSDAENVWVDDSDSHSLIIGGSGSKKNRLIIFLIVYLLAQHNENILISDPKGETLARTGNFLKKQGYKLRIIDLRHAGRRGDFWNPLILAFRHYKAGRIDEAQEMFADFVNTIAAQQKATTNDIFWAEIASALAMGILLVLAECATEDEMNVGSFASLCSQDNEELLEKLAAKLPHDSIAAINLKGVLSSPEKTKQSIYATLFGMVSMFINQKNLITALSNSTFELEDATKEKTAIFIITPDEKSTYNFVVSLMVKQLYQVLIAKAQENNDLKLKIRFNFVLDEMCNIPQIPDFTNMISAGRSRNIRFFLVIQSLHQLQAKYGEDETQTIIGNCSNLVYLHSRELPLLKMLSELCGERYLSDGSTRPLITPSQLQRLDKQKGEALIFCGRLYPYVTSFPDIDEYEMFKGYSPMVADEVHPEPSKMFSLKQVYDEIYCGIRPIPFTEKKEENYIEKFKSSQKDFEEKDQLAKMLEQRFGELFGDVS